MTGGPSAADLADAIRSASSSPLEDLRTFVDALIFNWLIVGTDTHAKNYSLLLGARGLVRLAPLYDIASALPYRRIPFQKAKLAMKIGGKYRARDIGKHQWEKQAAALGWGAEEIVAELRRILDALPDASAGVLAECEAAGLKNDLLQRLHSALVDRAERLRGRARVVREAVRWPARRLRALASGRAARPPCATLCQQDRRLSRA